MNQLTKEQFASLIAFNSLINKFKLNRDVKITLLQIDEWYQLGITQYEAINSTVAVGEVPKRLSRDEYFIRIAQVVAERSTCSRAKVGAVLVDPRTNRIVATGYNGSIKGSPHCIDVGCMMVEDHCRRTIHAEMNAVLHLEHNYDILYLYSTHEPCAECFKALKTANVVKMTYINRYKDDVRDLIRKELEDESRKTKKT